ncbi:MAG: VanZ family protein [Lachnospiraceae bacterium]|nr:VanZ family protein [Lachnospiraceae bacterium]
MKANTKKYIRVAGRVLFVLYILLLAYFLFFAEWYGRGMRVEGEYHYNLHLFREISRYWKYQERLGFMAVFLNLAGNVIGFIPLGFILPVIHHRYKHIWLVTLLGFTFSLFVETIQLFVRVGSFDVDDMLLNTLGTVIGYICFLICDRIRRSYGKRT